MSEVVPFRRFLAAKLELSAARASASQVPSITLSRQAGARAVSIGEKLVQSLQEDSPLKDPHWTLFDQDLVRTIVEDNDLPPGTEQDMPEDSVSMIGDAVREVFRKKPSDWTLFEHTVHTIRKLCDMGHAIVVGRGGNHIAADLANTFRVRLVGSFACRRDHVMEKFGMTEKAADDYLDTRDNGRRRYVKAHLGEDIEGPASYDLIINTDRLSDDTVVSIIIHAVASWSDGPSGLAKSQSAAEA